MPPRAKVILAAVVAAMSLFAVRNDTGSTAMWYLATGFSMTAVIFILRFFRYTVLDYACLFTGFVFIRHSSFSYLFGDAVTMMFVFGMIIAVTWIRLGTLRGNLFYVWFISIFTSLEGNILEYIFDRYVRPVGYMFTSEFAKLAVWGTAMVIIVFLNLALVYGIKRLFKRAFDEINDMGHRYPRIEDYFIYSTASILGLIGTAHFALRILGYFSELSLLFNIFTLFALAIQLSFLIMLFRLTWLRDSVKRKESENLTLAAYSSGLEKNIDDIRNLKHDIKNIFLTMAGFVERSGDEDMKIFYKEKISPFADDEIQKSDLYAKLSNLKEERLKAFLFYKISQIIGRGIALELEIAPNFVSGADLEFTDLIRILGIFLDNAAEECLKLPNGTVSIKLTQDDETMSYTVRNSVRPETRERGIHPGVSSKGSARGRGLVIVNDIIRRNENVSLNSYFASDGFVQRLVCRRPS